VGMQLERSTHCKGRQHLPKLGSRGCHEENGVIDKAIDEGRAAGVELFLPGKNIKTGAEFDRRET